MKRAFALSMLILSLVGCRATAGHSDKHDRSNNRNADARTEKAKADVMQAVKQYTAALTQKDIATLEKLWSDDLVFINPRGQVQTKSQRLADIRSGATVVKAIEMTEESVRVCGNAALALSRTKIDGVYNGKDASGNYRATIAWVRKHDAWRIEVIQLTAVQD